MIFSNISLGENVEIDTSSTFNNIVIGNFVRVAKMCSIFGSKDHIAVIGDNSYIGMMSILNGFGAKLTIGSNVSFAQHVNVMTDSGPNASLKLQKIFPIEKGEVTIGDNSWIGADTIIMPNVTLGKFCVVAANSFVNRSFEDFSIIGGSPAKLIRKFTQEEIDKVLE